MSKGNANLTILVVGELEDLKAPLESTRCELVRAHNGDEALDALHHQEVALIVLDASMEGALNFVAEARVSPSLQAIPILIVGDERHQDMLATASQGPLDVLARPFEASFFRNKVHLFLESSKKHLHLERLKTRLAATILQDQLTHLPNRKRLEGRLESAFGRSDRNGKPVGVLFLNLNDFRPINDRLGRDVGDRVLQTVAKRVAASVRVVDLVARIGGDEFVVVLEGMQNSEHAALVAERIRSSLQERVEVDGHEVFLTASIGGAVYPDDGQSASGLIQKACSAMERARETSGGSFEFYSAELSERIQARNVMVMDLQQALVLGEFRLHYQPQVHAITGEVVGVESLLRWQRGDKLVGPYAFISVLEETGLINEVGLWVLRTACLQLCSWIEEGLDPVRVSVNVSPRQMKKFGFVDEVRVILEETGVDPDYLELEITEGLLMEGSEENIRIMQELKGLGLRLSIDDFGTGYSSLVYLRRFPVDVIKIDRAFVKDIPDSDDGVIAKMVMGLARGLGMITVAEGVETQEQLSFLREHECEVIQGYFFSKPLPADECKTYIVRSRENKVQILSA